MPIKPYRQGDLDGLCGLYALINASRLADRSLIRNEDDCQNVFQRALRWLALNHKDFPVMLCDGVAYDMLSSVHKQIFQTQWPKITQHRPFQNNMPEENPQGTRYFWSEMNRLAAQPNQALLIGIGRSSMYPEDGMDHWSVVHEITKDKIVLFDSNRQRPLPRSICGPYEGNRVHYVIGPGYVLLLRKNI